MATLSACSILFAPRDSIKSPLKLRARLRKECRSQYWSLIIMLNPILFKPAPNWQVFSAFGGALLVTHLSGARVQQRAPSDGHFRYPDGNDRGDGSTSGGTDATTGRSPIPTPPPPPEAIPNSTKNTTPPPQFKPHAKHSSADTAGTVTGAAGPPHRYLRGQGCRSFQSATGISL